MFATIFLQQSSTDSSTGWAIGILLVGVIIAIAMIAAIWKLFVKAERPGWASLIPIYNVIVWLNIIGRPWWYVLALVTPATAVVLWVILAFGTARSYGRGIPFALGVTLLPFIFIPVLGFNSAAYIGGMGPSYRRGPKMPQQA